MKDYQHTLHRKMNLNKEMMISISTIEEFFVLNVDTVDISSVNVIVAFTNVYTAW